MDGYFGFDPVYMPKVLFDFQSHIVDWAIRKGRAAIFADTGLGKTLMQLVIAENLHRHTRGRVLILTPLAVAYQFIKESPLLDLSGIGYSPDGKTLFPITITNYERLHYFNPSDFTGVMLDESSILKNFDGAIKTRITSFMRKHKYRFLSTATPSPNDFVELGTSSEALGYMGYTDMLGRFFTNNEDTIKPQNIGTKWILKGHAVQSFFDWVKTWSITIRRPSDLGYSDDKMLLPHLNIVQHEVRNKKNLVVDGQYQMFPMIAKRLTEVRAENKITRQERCEKAVQVATDMETVVYWCNYNNEGDLIAEMDPKAIQIKGSMKMEQKEEILMAFQDGGISRLITKPKITAFGLNWQHCNKTIYFPTFSYEQYYQAVRRFWRFGQQHPVGVHLIYSTGQRRIIDALQAKMKKADELFENLKDNTLMEYTYDEQSFNTPVKKPFFL